MTVGSAPIKLSSSSPRRLFAAGAVAALLALASLATAEIRLVSETPLPDGAWQYKLAFTSRADAPATLRSESIPVPDPLTGEVEQWVAEERAVDLGVESLLLALPAGASDNQADWQVEVATVRAVAGQPLGVEQAASAVEVTFAQAGSFRAAQVTIDPAATGSARVAAMGLVVTIPAAATKGRTSLSPGAPSVVADAASLSLAGRLFANPATAADQLNEAVAATRQRSAAAGPSRLAAIPPPPGTHRITYTEGDSLMRVPMATIGASAGTIDQLAISHHGQAVARGGVLGGDVWFFAPRRVTLSAINDSVFTSMEATPSPDMATRSAYTTLAPSVTPVEIAVSRTRRWDQNQRLYPRLNMDSSLARPIYERSLDKPLGERFPFHRAQNPPSSSVFSSYSYQLPVLDVVTDPNVTMKAGFNGINQRAANPDHFANLTLAGTALPQASWEGIADFYEHTYNIAFAPIPTSANWTLVHSVPAPGGIDLDSQNLAYVELTWTGQPRVINSRRGDLELPAAGSPRRVTIAGFPAGTTVGQIYLLDVTDPVAPVRLNNPTLFTDGSGGIGIEFEAPATACRFYVERVTANADIAFPTTIALSESLPDALPDGVALRAIYVRQPSLATALQPLVNQRGPGILTLEPQAAYNTFNGGQQSPEALRDAIRTLVEEAPLRVPVPVVLLVGHGSYDRCNFLNLHTYPQITFFLDESIRTNGFTVEKSVDYPYSLLFGADNVPDVLLGRLPVRDGADLTMAVNRLLAHDAATSTLAVATRPALFIADDQAGGDPPFAADQPALVATWTPNGRPNRKMTIDFPNPDLGNLFNNAAVKLALEEKGPGNVARGMSYVFYVGHGELNTWAGEKIATSGDSTEFQFLGNFNTTGQWPVVATFTCLNGNFALPVAAPVPPATGRTMVEAWLFHSDRGAAACIAPVSVETYDVVKLMQSEFSTILGRADEATRPVTLGDAWYETLVVFGMKYPSLASTLREYLLFGDPETLSMVVPYQPDLKVSIASAPIVAQPNDIVTFTAIATNLGPGEARDVEVLVTIPASVSYLASTQAFGTNVPSGQTVLFNFGSLQAGESAGGVVIGQLSGAPPAESFATAVVSSDFADPVAGNNTATIGVGTTFNNFMTIY